MSKFDFYKEHPLIWDCEIIQCWNIYNKRNYEIFERCVNSKKKDWSFAEVYFWCDASGYKYYLKHEDTNYVMTDIVWKKNITPKRIEKIEKYLEKIQDIFINKLNKYE